jgi:carbamoylphosphate synthase large subunit
MTAKGAPTILFLGAAPFQVPPIRYARDRGYVVVTCDNRPDNPGHCLAHRSYDVSTADLAMVEKVARHERVDGIVPFGSDLSARTASLISEQLGLPTAPASAIDTLTDKARFRTFLADHGLQDTYFRCFDSTQPAALSSCLRTADRPLVVKPVDGNGSKGVAVLNGTDEQSLVQRAFAASRSGQVVIEEFVPRLGPQICGDGWMEQSALRFVHFGDGHFDDASGSKVPYAETFPSRHDADDLAAVRAKLEEVLRAVGYANGPFNFDVLLRGSRQPFIIEIGPRSGGNFIPSAIHLSSGTDLVAASVESSIRTLYTLPLAPAKADPVASYMIHTYCDGRLRAVKLSSSIRHNIVQHVRYVETGQTARAFTSADRAIGNLLLRFDDREEMAATLARMRDLVGVRVD